VKEPKESGSKKKELKENIDNFHFDFSFSDENNKGMDNKKSKINTKINLLVKKKPKTVINQEFGVDLFAEINR